MKVMDVDKIQNIMQSFENSFKELDISSTFINDTMNTTTSSTTPKDEVDQLLLEISDQHDLELGRDMNGLLSFQQPQLSSSQSTSGNLLDDMDKL
eukprot:CAMPEP_0117429450 /NCGR_PEP_ID=MMETSP0758-20121206/9009_1 /TAXON_ID=63605 /ORGANISM="Percolomonas cosmopolitus, Strain AE-1 (ATCC 50343)" /LENGTH=94 /DNA_ID=CAMNT_0005216521 /DNA_START=277 /DNA_END=558 /DNA_ORIENTATION=-